jgi:DNA-binding response OmpR family regulator
MRDDKLRGFQIGVDDYITKPFDEEELLYRVKAILARTRKPDNLNPEPTDVNYQLGKYQFDCLNQRLILNDITNRLTVKESAILRILCSARNKLVKREELMLEVWGESNYFNGRSLDVFISKLRKYLKSDPGIQITSIPTVGYILEVRE